MPQFDLPQVPDEHRFATVSDFDDALAMMALTGERNWLPEPERVQGLFMPIHEVEKLLASLTRIKAGRQVRGRHVLDDISPNRLKPGIDAFWAPTPLHPQGGCVVLSLHRLFPYLYGKLDAPRRRRKPLRTVEKRPVPPDMRQISVAEALTHPASADVRAGVPLLSPLQPHSCQLPEAAELYMVLPDAMVLARTMAEGHAVAHWTKAMTFDFFEDFADERLRAGDDVFWLNNHLSPRGGFWALRFSSLLRRLAERLILQGRPRTHWAECQNPQALRAEAEAIAVEGRGAGHDEFHRSCFADETP
jgi:hypothetical protein